jgi:hypothetical protein
MRFRWYAPLSLRFISEDPLIGVNRYQYVLNNPMRLIDPLGLDTGHTIITTIPYLGKPPNINDLDSFLVNTVAAEYFHLIYHPQEEEMVHLNHWLMNLNGYYYQINQAMGDAYGIYDEGEMKEFLWWYLSEYNTFSKTSCEAATNKLYERIHKMGFQKKFRIIRTRLPGGYRNPYNVIIVLPLSYNQVLLDAYEPDFEVLNSLPSGAIVLYPGVSPYHPIYHLNYWNYGKPNIIWGR